MKKKRKRKLQFPMVAGKIQAKHERKHGIDNGPLNKEEKNNQNKLKLKTRNCIAKYFWALQPEATHQRKRCQYQTEADEIKSNR